MIGKKSRIAILGGYGRMGLSLARLLLRETGLGVVLVGRDRARSARAAEELNAEFSGNRVAARVADASVFQDLAIAIEGVDLVVVCITGAPYTGNIVRAALEAGADLLDLRYPPEILNALRDYEPAIRRKERCVFTQAGHLPGLSAVLLRYASARYKPIRKAVLATAIRMPFLSSPGAADEMIDGMRTFRSKAFIRGQWENVALMKGAKVRFGPPFGTIFCLPAYLEEMNSLPEKLSIQEARVYVAGMNWFVNGCVAPLAVLLGGRSGSSKTIGLLSRMLRWGVNTFAKPPFGAIHKLELVVERNRGSEDLLEMRAWHGDSYYFAATAVAASLVQYGDGSIGKPGVHFMCHEVDPARMLEDMKRWGISWQESRWSGVGARSVSRYNRENPESGEHNNTMSEPV